MTIFEIYFFLVTAFPWRFGLVKINKHLPQKYTSKPSMHFSSGGDSRPEITLWNLYKPSDCHCIPFNAFNQSKRWRFKHFLSLDSRQQPIQENAVVYAAWTDPWHFRVVLKNPSFFTSVTHMTRLPDALSFVKIGENFLPPDFVTISSVFQNCSSCQLKLFSPFSLTCSKV